MVWVRYQLAYCRASVGFNLAQHFATTEEHNPLIVVPASRASMSETQSPERIQESTIGCRRNPSLADTYNTGNAGIRNCSFAIIAMLNVKGSSCVNEVLKNSIACNLCCDMITTCSERQLFNSASNSPRRVVRCYVKTASWPIREIAYCKSPVIMNRKAYIHVFVNAIEPKCEFSRLTCGQQIAWTIRCHANLHVHKSDLASSRTVLPIND